MSASIETEQRHQHNVERVGRDEFVGRARGLRNAETVRRDLDARPPRRKVQQPILTDDGQEIDLTARTQSAKNRRERQFTRHRPVTGDQLVGEKFRDFFQTRGDCRSSRDAFARTERHTTLAKHVAKGDALGVGGHARMMPECAHRSCGAKQRGLLAAARLALRAAFGVRFGILPSQSGFRRNDGKEQTTR
jgi:hypothetical protein